MTRIQLRDELQHVIQQQVAKGVAADAEAFLEEAVMRLVEDARAEEDDIRRAVEAGIADAEAGRYKTVISPEDERRLQKGAMARLRSRLAADR